jgi:hypothetical protein
LCTAHRSIRTAAARSSQILPLPALKISPTGLVRVATLYQPFQRPDETTLCSSAIQIHWLLPVGSCAFVCVCVLVCVWWWWWWWGVGRLTVPLCNGARCTTRSRCILLRGATAAVLPPGRSVGASSIYHLLGSSPGGLKIQRGKIVGRWRLSRWLLSPPTTSCFFFSSFVHQ